MDANFLSFPVSFYFYQNRMVLSDTNSKIGFFAASMLFYVKPFFFFRLTHSVFLPSFHRPTDLTSNSGEGGSQYVDTDVV